MKKSIKKVKVEMSEEQAFVVLRALNLYSRLSIGQIEEITEVSKTPEIRNENEVKDVINKLKVFLFPELSFGSFYSIAGSGTSESAKESWDIYQSIRYKLYWALYPEGGIQVYFNEPFNTSGKEFPKVEVESE